MMYFPEYGSGRVPTGVHKLALPGGGAIAVLHRPNPGAHHTIWFFHGNAEDLGDVEPFVQALHAAGFGVIAWDYPGYGHSSGRPSEESLYAAARRVREYLRGELKVPAERTLILGRSLGGGPATQMALEERVGGLILQSTFTSAFSVVTRWRILPFDPYVNVRKLPRIACPVLVMHGEADEVIAFRHGLRLFEVARGPKRALWVAGAHHNDFLAVAGPRFWAALREFSALCAQAPAGTASAAPSR